MCNVVISGVVELLNGYQFIKVYILYVSLVFILIYGVYFVFYLLLFIISCYFEYCKKKLRYLNVSWIEIICYIILLVWFIFLVVYLICFFIFKDVKG